MRFRFLGANDGHVTGSCTHFSYDRKNIQFLVDCGLVQGEGNDYADNSRPFPFNPSEIDFIFLTHAHQDHCGLIPKLYKDGFSGRVICTSATARLAKISLLDSAKHANGLYTEQDVNKIRFEKIDQREGFSLSRMLPIHTDLFASFLRSAHILGSVSITIGWINENEERSYMVMSGDLGNNTKSNQFQPLLAGRQGIFGDPTSIVIESTYGGRVRDAELSSFEGRILALKEIIQEEVFNKKSILIIPAFALQRTQELLFDLHYVFKKYFSTEDSSQSSVHSINPWYDLFEHKTWNGVLQQSLERVIETMPFDEQDRWKNAIIRITEPDRSGFSLRDGCDVSITEIKKLISETQTLYPVDIVLDSPLAREFSSVFHDELCHRQNHNTNETIYRNRSMPERFGVSDEIEVDKIVKSLLPNSDEDIIEIPIGVHSIRYERSFKIPRTNQVQERGCILITGGGMCDGGPVVAHLEKVISSKRPAVILLSGYMAKSSLGSTLVEISKAQLDDTPMPSETYQVGEKLVASTDITARVIQLQGYYSGHADQSGLMDFIFRGVGRPQDEKIQKPATIFLNHGQHSARKIFKEVIESRAATPEEGDRIIVNIELPDGQDRWYDLNTQEWLAPEPDSKTDALLKALLNEQRKTNSLLARMLDHKNTSFQPKNVFKHKGNIKSGKPPATGSK